MGPPQLQWSTFKDARTWLSLSGVVSGTGLEHQTTVAGLALLQSLPAVLHAPHQSVDLGEENW